MKIKARQMTFRQDITKYKIYWLTFRCIVHNIFRAIKLLKEQLFSISMILFLNRNDEKWPHTRQIKFAGRNHILPPLGVSWITNNKQFPRGN
jgi:hypothetical protein